jgi:hypothetical protein
MGLMGKWKYSPIIPDFAARRWPVVNFTSKSVYIRAIALDRWKFGAQSGSGHCE